MSSRTRLKPEKFVRLNLAKYLRLLEKDLARASTRSSLKDYVAIKYYRFGGKRQSIIMLVDYEDEAWTPIIDEAIKKGKKHAFGKCKIVSGIDKDGNGEEDITIGIKTAEGTMGKKYVTKMLNDDLFEDDPDVEVVLLKDLTEDESDSEVRNMRKKDKGDSTQASGSTGNGFHSKISKTLQDKDMLEAFESVIRDALGDLDANDLYTEAKSKMVTLKAAHEEHLTKSTYNSTVLPLVESTNSYLDMKLELLREVLEQGSEVLSYYKEKIDTFMHSTIARGNEKAVNLQMGIIRKLILRLEKLEATLEDFFELENETDQLDDYNDIIHSWRKYQRKKPTGDEAKMGSLLQIEYEIKAWLTAFSDNSNKSTVIQKEKLNEISESVKSTMTKITSLNKTRLEDFEKIKQKELQLDRIKPTAYSDRLKLALELEELISDYESDFL
ncbi:MAG: hypothetical protein AAF502_12805 [Bacteroidota bacterium]